MDCPTSPLHCSSPGSTGELLFVHQCGQIRSGFAIVFRHRLTGEAGTFDLMFLLWPPAGEGEGYADKLASHFPEDIWSTIHLPSDSRPDDHWMNSPLTTHFTLDSPVNVVFDEGADVAGPASLPLLLIGGTLLMVRRFRPIA